MSIVIKRSHGRIAREGQRGASLLFALITLVALALAATALVRSVDTGAIVLGNLSSKKSTSAAADRVTQEALAWLATRGGDGALIADRPNEGYYANFKADFDFTGFQSTDVNRKLVNWDVDGSCAYATAGGVCDANTRPSNKITVDNGIEGRFLITRLCTTSGISHTDGANSCAVPPKIGQRENTSRGDLTYGYNRPPLKDPVPFYRIVVRVVGPRNAVTYAESIVNL
jgi:type IV pilus assembly protein PilX